MIIYHLYFVTAAKMAVTWNEMAFRTPNTLQSFYLWNTGIEKRFNPVCLSVCMFALPWHQKDFAPTPLSKGTCFTGL